MRFAKTAAFLACAAVFLSGAAQAATLMIEISGLRSATGLLHYAVYDRAEAFPTREGRIAAGQPRVTGTAMTISVEGLKPGTYAVAIFHDENANEEFDQGLFGIPLEDYAFSNNATGFFGPPSFADASFAVIEPETRIRIGIGD